MSWTIETLKEHFESLRAADDQRYAQLREKEQTALQAALNSAEKAVQSALLTSKEAVTKAEVATEKRLEALNELRQNVATKDALDAVDRRLAELKETVSNLQSTQATLVATQVGRAGGLKDYIGWIVAAVTVAGAVIAMLSIR